VHVVVLLLVIVSVIITIVRLADSSAIPEKPSNTFATVVAVIFMIEAGHARLQAACSLVRCSSAPLDSLWFACMPWALSTSGSSHRGCSGSTPSTP
jgi:hypothetical protein